MVAISKSMPRLNLLDIDNAVVSDKALTTLLDSKKMSNLYKVDLEDREFSEKSRRRLLKSYFRI